MHILQPKHTILKKQEVETLLKTYNISINQLPKIKITDKALPEEASIDDVIKVQRKEGDETVVFYRVVVI